MPPARDGLQAACRMDLLAQARIKGVQSEFVDARESCGSPIPWPSKSILDALPEKRVCRFVSGPVVVRALGHPAHRIGTIGRAAAPMENHAATQFDRARRDARARDRLARRPAARLSPADLTDAEGCDGRSADDRGARAGLWRRFRPRLAAGRAALQRPLGPQLGHRRFHRSRRSRPARQAVGAPTASGSIRCMSCSTTIRPIAAPIRRTAGCFSIRSISTSRRSRNFPPTSSPTRPRPPRGCATAIASLSGHGGAEMARPRAAFDSFVITASGVRRNQFDAFPRGSRATVVPLCLLRGAPASLRGAVVGMAEEWQQPDEAKCAELRNGPRQARGRVRRIRAMDGRSAIAGLPGAGRPARHAGRALSRCRGRRAVQRLRCLERAVGDFAASRRSARRRICSTPRARTGASPASMPVAWKQRFRAVSPRCCQPRCAMPARSGSITCWA